MVIRRVGAVVVVVSAVFATVLVTGGTARAADLTVTVAAVAPGRVELTAYAGAADQKPAVTVSHEGAALPSTVDVGAAPASPVDARALVVVLYLTGTAADATRQAAEDAVLGLSRAVPADVEIGLVTATDAPSVIVRPTRDRDGLRVGLSSIRSTGRPGLGNELSTGLTTAAGLMSRYPNRRLMVLSDGPDSVDATVGAPVVKALTTAGIRVDVVDLRPATGQGWLRQLSAVTGGTGYRATNRNESAAAFHAAAAAFPQRLTITVTVPAKLAGRSGSLTVDADVGATRFHAVVPVRFAPRAAGTGAGTGAGRTVGRRLASLRLPLMSVVVFVAVFAVCLLATAPLRRPVRPQRLSQVNAFRVGTREVPGAGPTTGPGNEHAAARAVLGISDRMVRIGGAEARMAARLEQAGMTIRPREWIVLRACAATVPAMLFALLAGPAGLVVGAVLGWLSAGLYRRQRQTRRRRALAEHLPDALQLVVGSLKSGFSLAQALDAVSRDLPPGPLAAAFGRVTAEARIGADLGDALERAAERTGNTDLSWIVMAIRIQRDTGGNLAEVLATTVDTLRERERLRRQVWALSAEGRLSAYILIALPVLMGLWLFLTRRDYLTPLWTTPTGLVMLFGATGLLVVGSIWMSRWVKVEV